MAKLFYLDELCSAWAHLQDESNFFSNGLPAKLIEQKTCVFVMDKNSNIEHIYADFVITNNNTNETPEEISRHCSYISAGYEHQLLNQCSDIDKMYFVKWDVGMGQPTDMTGRLVEGIVYFKNPIYAKAIMIQ